MGVIKVQEPPHDANAFAAAWGYVTTILSGMKFTAITFLKQITHFEKTNTLEWPEQAATYSERFKGKHFLTLRDDGEVRCTACMLCATNCPAQCIHIEAGERPDKEKYPVKFEIDLLRCCFCGMCEEACPKDAIKLSKIYEMSVSTRTVYNKDYLLEQRGHK